MAKSIYYGLCSKKATLCEAEVGTGKTMAYLVAGFVAKLFDDSYSFMGYPVTITTSSIELQKSIMEKELPALSNMLMAFGLIARPLTAVLRKGKDHYFCPKRYHEYMDSISLFPVKYSKTIHKVKALDLLSNTLDLDPVPLNPFIKARICVNGSCHDCPRTDYSRYAEFLGSASNPYHFDFQITNHNLFLTAQKSKSQHSAKGGLLPCNFCIIDEAHKLLETASGVFGAQLKFTEVEAYLRSVKHNGGYDFKDRAEYLRLLKEAERLIELAETISKARNFFTHYGKGDKEPSFDCIAYSNMFLHFTLLLVIYNMFGIDDRFIFDCKSRIMYKRMNEYIEKIK
jgi:ATP-dependent DNA helicase DinG